MSDEGDIELSHVTWPRSRIPDKLISDFQTRTRIQATLGNIKLKAKDPEVSKLVENLTELLAKADDETNTVIHSPPQTTTSKAGGKLLKKIKRSTLRNEPYFGSMILCSEPSSKKKSSGSIQLFDGNEGYITEEIEDAMEENIPLYAKIIPFCLLFSIITLYITFGTFTFQYLDPSLGNKSFHEVLLLPFQTVVTIGWGNLPILQREAQLFCVFYSLFGIPLALTTLTQIGKIFFKKFTIDWILNSAVLRHHPKNEEKILFFPVFKSLNFLFPHFLLAFIIFNGYLGDLGIIKTFYFNYLSISMIGFGDVSPEVFSLFQTILVCFFLIFGSVFLAVIHVALCYHIQRLYFVVLKNYIYRQYIKNNPQRKPSSYSIKRESTS